MAEDTKQRTRIDKTSQYHFTQASDSSPKNVTEPSLLPPWYLNTSRASVKDNVRLGR